MIGGCNMKPKIALITDTDNWAFYNRAVVLSEKLKDYYHLSTETVENCKMKIM